MNIRINKELKEILVGKLLGDAHMELQKGAKNYRLKIEHSFKQKDYVDWLYKHFSLFCSTPPQQYTRILKGKEYIKFGFQTKAFPNFFFFGHNFYKDKKKVI